MLFSPPLFMHSCFPPKGAKDETPRLLVLSPDPSLPKESLPRPLEGEGGGEGEEIP